ncbi:RNA-directed DNA polymerase from mobile element jockey [Araneus ventricosus]|uniref:RNA-directed DNA polymerase from mobile element jockey n=1 Tax=Araneus ventricosus TaxID=182803 RepID=A0A4Y2HF54_ARAVE|nr:RNA-directed DNA polymerase from mobile element jockey [Araneus ventricosus]
MEPAPGYKMYSSKNGKAIVIICNKNIKPYIKFQSEHIIIVELHIGNKILNISSVYFPPHDNIDNLINEFLNYDFNGGINVVTGDFNCRSRLWDYQVEDDRGRSMTDFISLNNLHICNIPELGPSFISTTFGKGNPDLTLISSSFQDGIKQWGILDRLSLSDHNLELNQTLTGEYFLKTRYECLRKAKIFFLQKSGKDPKSCDAYRPVCLLPTIGKILERVFQNRFNKYLSLNNIIHRNQKGFREGSGCDRALDNIANKIRETRSNQHCALISLDIKAAFDNMDWSVLFKIFDFYKIPLFYRNFIYYYLLDRKVVFKDGTLEIERDSHKSCPQGSVVAPNLWNIYVNRILEINSERVFLQAFADDLALVTAGSVRKELEINTNEALELIHLTLVELKLELSVGKCQRLAFRSLVRHQKRKGQNIFKRNSSSR